MSQKRAALGCAAILFVVIVAIASSNAPDRSKSSSAVPTVAEAEAQLSSAMQDPRKVRLMECIGVNPYKDSPSSWQPPSKEECFSLEKLLGMSDNELTYEPLPDAPSGMNDSQSEPVATQGPDAAQMQAYVEARGALLEKISDLYFAVGCHVIDNEASIQPLIARLGATINAQAQNGPQVIVDRDGQNMMFQAKQRGLNRASNCDYWTQNADAASAIRQEVMMAVQQ